MTLNKLASMIAKKEGKKSQASIGDIREIIKITLDLCLDISMKDLALFFQAEMLKRQKKLLKGK